MTKKLFLFLFSLGVFFIFTQNVQALTMSPTQGLITVDRNTVRKVEIKVFNETNKPLKLETQILGMSQDEDGLPVFKKGISEAEKWVSTDVDNFVLGLNESKEIVFNINVPDGIYPGSYYLGLAVKSSDEEYGGTGISSQLAFLLTIQVAGVAEEKISIIKWETVKSVYLEKELDFSLRFRNLSNVEVPLLGKIEIESFSGKKIYDTDYYMGNQLLVDSIRQLNPKVELPKDRFLLPGLYKAKVLINYGKTNQVIEGEINFLYTPVWSLVVGIFVVLIIILMILKLKGKIKKKK